MATYASGCAKISIEEKSMNRYDLTKYISNEFNEQRALETAVHMTQFYRSPGAEGYHRATDFVRKVFNDNQLDIIKKNTKIVYSSLENIENNSGGSARCMIAEVF